MLAETGRMDPAGLTRRARLRIHAPCRMPCLAGLDAAVAGLSTWCDLTELSAHGEAEALLDGRATYAVWTIGPDRVEIERRDQWSIAGRPAGDPRARPVLATHRCEALIPPAWAAQARHQPITPALTAATTDCPF